MNEPDALQQIRELMRRGERDTAQTQLADILLKNPKNENAWMLMARVVETPQQKKDCYERAIKLNPNNIEAKKELVRMDFPGHTYDAKRGIVAETPKELAGQFKLFTRLAFLSLALFAVLISGTLVYAKNNPDSQLAQMIPDLPSINDLQKFNPLQYDSPVEAFVAFLKEAANGGMDGAPAMPDIGVIPSTSAGEEVIARLDEAMQNNGTFAFGIDEYQATSIAVLVLQHMPELPIRDPQVYFRDGKILAWGMVDGDTDSTSALAVANLTLDANGVPVLEVISAQVGKYDVPPVILNRMQTEINDAFVQSMNTETPRIYMTDLEIGNNMMSFILKR